MKGFRNRYLAAAYVLLLAAAFVVGCSTKEDPAEELVVCGNHSCGDLAMVTIDTSSDGWQYLDPAFSPDGTRIAFTADWGVIPSIPGGDPSEPVLARQILLMPIPADIWADTMIYRDPVADIRDLGAELVFVGPFNSPIGADYPNVHIVENAHRLTKDCPVWLDDTTILFLMRFDNRDRMLMADISNPGQVTPELVFIEDDDTRGTNFWFYYHGDPALSPDGRWLVFTRYGCNTLPNQPEAICTGEALWMLDLNTLGDPAAVTAFPITSEAADMEDPAWSPDGRSICFSSSVDLAGQYSGSANELFLVRFDPEEAETGTVTIDNGLERLTTTSVSEGDPIVGLHNYAPFFNSSGTEIYFTSSRRAPGSTQRGRNLWRIPSDGRLEPELLFYSRMDDVDPVVYWPTGTILVASRMGFPSEMLDALEQKAIDRLWAENEDLEVPLTEVEILRRAADEREELEFFEDVMSHLFLYRGF